MPTGEIALLEGLTVVYKSSIDLYFYVIGSSHENEVDGGTQGCQDGGTQGCQDRRDVWGDGDGDTGVTQWGHMGCRGKVETGGVATGEVGRGAQRWGG